MARTGNHRLALFGLVAGTMLGGLSALRGEGKELGPLKEPIRGHYWDAPFTPTEAYGSYNSIFRKPDGTLEMWNNTVGEGPKDGLVRFRGKSPTEWFDPQTLVRHDLIQDVFDASGKLSEKRRYTRPSVVFHRKDGYFIVTHVCDGYPPRDGSVYPALITSKPLAHHWWQRKSAAPRAQPSPARAEKTDGEWVYHGRLRGEIEEFLPGKNSRWADGRGLFYQPKYGKSWNDQDPLKHRFLFFSNQYPGNGCLALLYSATGETWKFHRKDGKIVNLLPDELKGKGMIFPQVIQAGRHGWYAWISENWPPTAIWRITSPDGLQWKLFGKRQPEIVKPEGVTIKTLSGWYDEKDDILHGYVAVWEKIGDGENYRLHHSTTRQFVASDEEE